MPPIENTLSTVSSLADHLTWQLSAQRGDDVVQTIGTAIVGNLDEDGYLAASIQEIAVMGSWPEAEVNRVLALVHTFDPMGVAARDLQECLLLQLRHLGLENTPSEVIVRDHLRLLENHHLPELARQLDLRVDELKDHIDIIRHLDPKPGMKYNPSPSQHVIPDVYVQKVEDKYVAVLNDDALPQLRINPVYRRLLDPKSQHSAETRSYVKDKFRSALWLIKSVDQRQKTIFKIATSLIAFQREFLDHGIEHLRPLVLRDVAKDIGMHESTVSRDREQQVHAHPARRGRDEVFLSQRHPQRLRRERLLDDDQAADPEDRPERGCPQAAERLAHCEPASGGGAHPGATHESRNIARSSGSPRRAGARCRISTGQESGNGVDSSVGRHVRLPTGGAEYHPLHRRRGHPHLPLFVLAGCGAAN